jgi:hypothetical protein
VLEFGSALKKGLERLSIFARAFTEQDGDFRSGRINGQVTIFPPKRLDRFNYVRLAEKRPWSERS